MQYRNISNTGIDVSVIALGTWAFGSDKWWGYQDDKKSLEVLENALKQGMNLIDTAPAYGRGHSEDVIGNFLKRERVREKIVIATKVGLSWEGSKVYHDLKEQTMKNEVDASRKRLNTDYIDIYQVHWPDPETPISETASVMNEFYKKGIIKAVGVSNYSVDEMREFMKYSPLHTVQPPYNMFKRDIENDIVPFCVENNMSILVYIPLHSGILTGKFFFDNVLVPNDICRKNHKDLQEPAYSINKETLTELKNIAAKYKKSLTQLVLNWTINRKGITSLLAGSRKIAQLKENVASADWKIEEDDLNNIEKILLARDKKLEIKVNL